MGRLDTLDLIAVRGLSVREAAEARGVKVGTIYKNLTRIRAAGRPIPRVNAKPVKTAYPFSLQSWD